MISRNDYLALLPFADGLPHSFDIDDDRIYKLSNLNLVSIDYMQNYLYHKDLTATITCEGCDALKKYKEVADQQTQKEHDKRIDRAIQILVPLITIVLGLLVGHFAEIVSFIKQLFD